MPHLIEHMAEAVHVEGGQGGDAPEAQCLGGRCGWEEGEQEDGEEDGDTNDGANGEVWRRRRMLLRTWVLCRDCWPVRKPEGQERRAVPSLGVEEVVGLEGVVDHWWC